MRQRRKNTSDVAICCNNNESEAILEGLNLIGAGNLIKKDDVVVITPNWVQNKTPETGIVVGNESLNTVISFVKAANPRRIVVVTGSGGADTLDVLEKYKDMLTKEGVEFIDLNAGPFIRKSLNHSRPSSTYLNRIYEEHTFLISFTQLKVHEEATISGAIKNIALSWPPAQEHGYPKKNLGIHDDLHGFILAMAEIFPIDLSIVSANPAMIGTGPAKGIPKHTGLVICGTDPVSVDTVGARILGFKPQAVRYLYEAGKKGLGETDLLKMNLYGIPIIQAEKEFSIKCYGTPVSVDED
ncbi:MAG: DUF362 domain-containing protein [Clostridiaceae bacterium]|nr:DUF362 domain-containing protein [Clostridiaceae bacterium]